MIGLLCGLLLAGAAVAVLITSGRLVVETRGPDTRPIHLPDRLGQLSRYIEVYRRSHTAAASDAEAGAVARANALTAATDSAAYGGAAVDVQRYAADDLSFRVTVVVIRAVSGPLLSGVRQDSRDTGLLAPATDVVVVGTTRCLIRRFLHGVGGDLDPFRQATDECQRTGESGTVLAYVDGAEGSAAQLQVVELTEAAYGLLGPA